MFPKGLGLETEVDIKRAELGVLGAHIIEAHFINDLLHGIKLLRHESHSPFPVVQAGAAGDKLLNAAGEFTAGNGVRTHEFFAREADLVVTLEDHVTIGGYGSRVIELLHEREIRTSVQRVAWPDQFIEHASGNGDLRKKYGLTAKAVVDQIKTPSAETAGDKASAVA